MRKFKVGDKVKISAEGLLGNSCSWTTPYINKVGEVTWNLDYYRVKWPSGETWAYYERALIPASVFYAEMDKKGLIV